MGVLVVTKFIHYRKDLSWILVQVPEISWFLFDDKHDSTTKPPYFVLLLHPTVYLHPCLFDKHHWMKLHSWSKNLPLIMAPHFSLCCAHFLLLIVQHLIKLFAPVAINDYLLFCVAPSTSFGPYHPSLTLNLLAPTIVGARINH